MFLRFKPELYDGVKEEMERRRPIYRRERFQAVVGIVLAIAIWLVARLMGLDTPFPFHVPASANRRVRDQRARVVP